MSTKIINGILLDEGVELTLADLSRACSQHAEWIIELVDEGILDPRGTEPRKWRFPVESLNRAHKAMRLERDLQINLAGIALALDLMEELNHLRQQLASIQKMGSG